MSSKTHLILSTMWSLIALYFIINFVITGELKSMLTSIIFLIFSAEQGILSEIKELKESITK